MPQFTPELSISIIIIVFRLLIECYLFLRFLNRYFNLGYPKTLLILLIALIFSLIYDISVLLGIFISQAEIRLFVDLKKIGAICFIIAVYLLLNFSETFEYDTIFTRQQMITSILVTLTVIVIFVGEFEPDWLVEEEIFSNSIDPLSNLLLLALTVFIGILMLLSFRNGFQDSWIVQKKQIILLMVGTSIGIIIPVVFKVILIVLNYSSYLILDFILDSLFTFTFIIFFFSFGSSELFSLFNRRKADKIVVTSQSGMPLFMYDFKIDVHHIDETLFGGAIVAITNLLAESMKSPAPIAEVLIKNRYRLMLESKPSFIALIFSPEGSFSSYLRESLELFVKKFDDKYGDYIASGEVIDRDLVAEGGIKFLSKSFGMPIDMIHIPETDIIQ